MEGQTDKMDGNHSQEEKEKKEVEERTYGKDKLRETKGTKPADGALVHSCCSVSLLSCADDNCSSHFHSTEPTDLQTKSTETWLNI
ncbi:hypothetical protein CHARACLAT_009634 [Characodon lateralis]|uniref:Uncharacterized protein n=1 Tax=Characodon lateralis TaxID=208331 RepID=A0ABU7E8F1_9TELE|nr:hypothetical protein [Characodon lateralis]